MPLVFDVFKDQIPQANRVESTTKLVKKLSIRKDEFIAALATTDFYVQLLIIFVSLSLAGLMSYLIRRRVHNHFEKHPPKRIDAEWIIRPLKLITPLLGLLYLTVLKPLADQYAVDGDYTEAAIQLCFAFFIARMIQLVVQSRPMANFIAYVIVLVALLRVTGFAPFTVAYLNSLSLDVGQFHISMLSLVHGVVILVIVFWIAGISCGTLESYLRRSSRLSYSSRELIVKFFRIFVYFIALLITLSAVGVDLTAFAVFGGALGVGVGLGLQKITANFVSGITLLMEKSIRIGDLIEVAGNTGWVRQLNIRYALIETADGRDILIPNEELVSTRVINWTHTSNQARIEIKVPASYSSDPTLVRDILLKAARSHPLCLTSPAPNCWLREFGDYALQFTLTFWIPDVHEGRLGPQSEVMMAIHKAFKEASVAIPSPQGGHKNLLEVSER